jgi:hypothetical protein
VLERDRAAGLGGDLEVHLVVGPVVLNALHSPSSLGANPA